MCLMVSLFMKVSKMFFGIYPLIRRIYMFSVFDETSQIKFILMLYALNYFLSNITISRNNFYILTALNSESCDHSLWSSWNKLQTFIMYDQNLKSIIILQEHWNSVWYFLKKFYMFLIGLTISYHFQKQFSLRIIIQLIYLYMYST